MKAKNSDAKKVGPDSDVQMTEMTQVDQTGDDKETSRLTEVQIAIPATKETKAEGSKESPINLGSPDSYFSWHHVGFSVTVKNGKAKEDKTLLADNTGQVNAGQVIAIMGGSGRPLFFRLIRSV